MGARAGYDGAKRRKGSKVHIAVETLGHLLALTVTAAHASNRTQAAALADEVQEATSNTVELAYVDQGYTVLNAAETAQQHGIQLEVINTQGKSRLRPADQTIGRRMKLRRGSRFRRLAREYEGLNSAFKAFHFVAFAILMVSRLINTALTNS